MSCQEIDERHVSTPQFVVACLPHCFAVLHDVTSGAATIALVHMGISDFNGE